MARIIAPNKDYAGVSAGVAFLNGEGHTDNRHLIEWFRSHGYIVMGAEEAKPAAATPAQRKKRRGKGG